MKIDDNKCVNFSDAKKITLDKNLIDFFEGVQEKLTEIHGPAFSMTDGAFNSIGNDEQHSQKVLDHLFPSTILKLLGHSPGLIRGYVIALDPFSGRYKSFGKIGNWIDFDDETGESRNIYEQIWRKKWMRGCERLVSEGQLAIRFIEKKYNYIETLESLPGRSAVYIQDWNDSKSNVSPVTRELNMGWSVTSPVYHRGRMIGFLNMGFRERGTEETTTEETTKEAEACARKNAHTIWWLAQNILSPFLFDASVSMDDTRLAALLWRASKFDRRGGKDRFAFDKEQFDEWQWLNDRVFLICAMYRNKETEEGRRCSSTQIIRQTINDLAKGSFFDDMKNKWFNVVIAEDIQEIPMPEKVLPGVLRELITNSFVAVRLLQKAGTEVIPPYVTVEVKRCPEIEDAKIEIIVRDNGIGMDAYTISRAFDLGFSGFIHTDEANGIGLNIVRLNVIEYDGEVQIESCDSEHYTMVSIKLPCIEECK